MRRFVISTMIGTVLLTGSALQAQQSAAPAAPSLDTIPEKMPFGEPYGTPISAQRAMSLVQAGVAEATKRGWAMNIAIVDSGANLVAFLRMDGAQLASISIAEHKARASAKYRRPTKAFEDAIQKNDYKYMLTLDDIVASRGGMPLIENGKIIGAIGCSGGTGSQDEAVCSAAAGALVKSP
jgi:glc operon protein GlcG